MKKLGPFLLIFLITYGAAKAAVAIFGEGATAAYVGGIVITIAFLYIESISSPKSTRESGAVSETKIIPTAPPASERKRPGKSPRLWESGRVRRKYRGLELARGAAADPRSG